MVTMRKLFALSSLVLVLAACGGSDSVGPSPVHITPTGNWQTTVMSLNGIGHEAGYSDITIKCSVVPAYTVITIISDMGRTNGEEFNRLFGYEHGYLDCRVAGSTEPIIMQMASVGVDGEWVETTNTIKLNHYAELGITSGDCHYTGKITSNNMNGTVQCVLTYDAAVVTLNGNWLMIKTSDDGWAGY
jgi:hypothetical protein